MIVLSCLVCLTGCSTQENVQKKNEKTEEKEEKETKEKKEEPICQIQYTNWKDYYLFHDGTVDLGELEIAMNDGETIETFKPENYTMYFNDEKAIMEDHIWKNAKNGTYNIRIDFQYKDHDYSYEKEINFEDMGDICFHELLNGTAQFDETPININNIGYLVKIQGRYGFVDIHGNWMLKPKYRSYDQAVGIVGLDEPGDADGCVSLNQNEAPNHSIILTENIGGSAGACGEMGGLPSGEYVYLPSTGSVSYYQYQSKEYQAVSEDPYYDDSRSYIIYDTLSDQDAVKDHYYIFSSTGTVYGPYSTTEPATSAAIRLHENENGFRDGMLHFDCNPSLTGPFYVREGYGYRIYDSSGTKYYSQLVQDVKVLSGTSLEVTINGQKGIIDENLNLVILGDFENVSKPIGNKTLAKIGDGWRIIEIQ